MFVILLRFSAQRERASEFMAGHKAWIDQGIDDGVFLLVGSLKPNGGGAILAHGVSRADLERRVNRDPFVEHQVVTVEIVEVGPSRVDERLRFLVEAP